jgi:hypothetical protein
MERKNVLQGMAIKTGFGKKYLITEKKIELKNSAIWNITPCSPLKSAEFSEKNVASIFKYTPASCQLRGGLLHGLHFSPED